MELLFPYRPPRGFTLMESLIAMFLVALVMTFTGLLFHRSFEILRTLDDKERTRQASRLGLDRITSELREATQVVSTGSGQLEFVKVDPEAVAATPEPAPAEPSDDFTPDPYNAQIAYPESARLLVRYRTENERLLRGVRQLSGGPWTEQVVVVGVNSFVCTPNPESEGEFDVEVSILDNRRVRTLRSRVVCPCIRAEFQP